MKPHDLLTRVMLKSASSHVTCKFERWQLVLKNHSWDGSQLIHQAISSFNLSHNQSCRLEVPGGRNSCFRQWEIQLFLVYGRSCKHITLDKRCSVVAEGARIFGRLHVDFLRERAEGVGDQPKADPVNYQYWKMQLILGRCFGSCLTVVVFLYICGLDTSVSGQQSRLLLCYHWRRAQRSERLNWNSRNSLMERDLRVWSWE